MSSFLNELLLLLRYWIETTAAVLALLPIHKPQKLRRLLPAAVINLIVILLCALFMTTVGEMWNGALSSILVYALCGGINLFLLLLIVVPDTPKWTILFTIMIAVNVQHCVTMTYNLLNALPGWTLPEHGIGMLLIRAGILAFLLLISHLLGRKMRLDDGVKVDGLTVLSCFGLTSVMNVLLRFVMEGNTDPVRIVLIELAWLFATVFIFAFHVLVLERARQTARAETAKVIAEREHRAYVTLKRNLETMRAMAHDMKYYTEALQRTGMPDRMATDRIAEAVRIYEETFDTGCEALDLLLSDKAAVCASKGISLICSADASQLADMDVGDLYSLFGNALDNAVEHLQTVAESEKRYIRLEVKEIGAFVSVTLRNYCVLPPISTDAIESTKMDKPLHGYGIPNIRSVAARYGGDLRIERTGTEFVLRVLLHIP